MTVQESPYLTPSKFARLYKRLASKEFRDNYCASFVKTALAHQIRTLRESRNEDQKAFAKRTGRPQSVISRLENPDYGKYSLQTLLELASDFDVALFVRFVRYSDFIRINERTSPADLDVQSFADDTGLWAELSTLSSCDTLRGARVRAGSSHSNIKDMTGKGPTNIQHLDQSTATFMSQWQS